MSTLETNLIQPATGTALTVGASGDTITIPSGATFNVAGTVGTGFTPGITEADMWRLTADLTSTADPVSANLERVDDATFAKIGTGMSVSTGIWTFPSTGLWHVSVGIEGETNASQQDSTLMATLNNSTYDAIAEAHAYGASNDATANRIDSFVNVTDVSNVKVKLKTALGGGSLLKGDTAYNQTNFVFVRLGDSQ